MQKNLVVSKVFSPSNCSLCKFRSSDKDYTTHCWISGLWCNFQRIKFFPWDSSFWGCFFFQWFIILYCPLMRFWSHTPQCPRFVTRPNTSPVVMLRSSSSVKPLVRDNGEAKRRSAKGTKTQSPGSEFSVFFWVGGRNWRGLETAPPKFHLGNNRLI